MHLYLVMRIEISNCHLFNAGIEQLIAFQPT